MTASQDPSRSGSENRSELIDVRAAESLVPSRTSLGAIDGDFKGRVVWLGVWIVILDCTSMFLGAE
jgi:hypothetical protein